jgi:hypothetical protein
MDGHSHYSQANICNLQVSEQPLKQEAKNRHLDDREQPWYFGHVSRHEAEVYLKKHAQQNQFLVRESATKVIMP